ncbi:ABC transporter ATP-binding protein [Demequina pelophila]|uniref:ABC transporter ATP-binding protein n=1 Tax=Demequina pelophila TaxID=1638984 RepID=UPI0007836067|nr:ATP-binding cassette domain-containing protein [Demequina pelophila]
MIQATDLTKQYGTTTAVDRVSFTLTPGKVTGFLGPNGAGKSTTMRMILGLDRPTSGTVTVAGRHYREHARPLAVLGALIDAKGVHPKLSARRHLSAVAATHGISRRRVDEVLELTGLTPVANKAAGTFSLGMGQRLGIATALLGDPDCVMLDEPVNGLDPDGVLWVRRLARQLADEGRTVFLSSHLMSEVQQTADQILVIGRGRILADAPLAEFMLANSTRAVRVTSPDAAALAQALRGRGATIAAHDGDTLTVTGIDTTGVAVAARDHGLLLTNVHDQSSTLEDAYMRLTAREVEYASAGTPATSAA